MEVKHIEGTGIKLVLGEDEIDFVVEAVIKAANNTNADVSELIWYLKKNQKWSRQR